VAAEIAAGRTVRPTSNAVAIVTRKVETGLRGI
jgi:hypothetical protein